jgi:hypothetical protein
MASIGKLSVSKALANPADYLARKIKRWTRQYGSARTHEFEAIDALMAWLPEHIPAGEITTIAHGGPSRKSDVRASGAADIGRSGLGARNP